MASISVRSEVLLVLFHARTYCIGRAGEIPLYGGPPWVGFVWRGTCVFYDYFVCLGCGCIFMFLKMILLDSLYSNTHTHAKEQTQIETSKHTNDTR